jgi:glycosyltransferase involved in cell wall biosynthesis
LPDLPYVFGWQADYAGCGYYRVELPVKEYLRQGGRGAHSTEVSPEIYEQADVIVGQRVLGPPATEAWKQWCDKADKLCVFEIDDDLFNIDPSNVAYTSYTPPYLANIKANIECAHVVTVTTAKLANMLSCLNSNIHIVPNRVPEWLTDWTRPRTEELTVGWAGSISHVMDWDDPAPQIGRFLQRNPEVKFHAVGGVFPSMVKWPRTQIRSTKWVDGVEGYYKVVDFDIGVIPLKPHLFNQSKSYIKALEYAALGIPAVVSDAGTYSDFVDQGKTGYLVQYDHEWSSILRDLANNPVKRHKMGYEARLKAKKHTIEGNLGSWLKPWGIDLPTGV